MVLLSMVLYMPNLEMLLKSTVMLMTGQWPGPPMHHHLTNQKRQNVRNRSILFTLLIKPPGESKKFSLLRKTVLKDDHHIIIITLQMA